MRLAPRHDITLLYFVDPEDVGAEHELPPGLAAAHGVPRLPWVPEDPLALLPHTVRGGFCHPTLRAAVEARLASERWDLVQFEYTEMGHLMPPPWVPTVLTVHQIGYARLAPAWRAGGGGLREGAVTLFRYVRDLDFELRALDRAHHVVTMSREDAGRLRRFRPDLPVTVSPVGVDCSDFRPVDPPPKPEVDLVFVGNFAHPPNADAVTFLVRDVLPRLDRPVGVRVVGHGIPSELRALANHRPGAIELAASVPDVRPHLAAAAAVVAPVRFGTGMRGKVLEGLAMGRPVITTSVGAEGLDAQSGRELLVADDAAAFAAAIAKVLGDPAYAAGLGRVGRAFVEERFDWNRIALAHEEMYEALLSRPLPPRPARGDGMLPAACRIAALGRAPALAASATLLGLRALRRHLATRRAGPMDTWRPP